MIKKLMRKFKSLFMYIKCAGLYYVSWFLSLFLRKTAAYKDLWIIAERGDDARDNGYHFFKFLRENHKEINCVYVIPESSPDYEKISSLGRTVTPNTFKHYLAFASSKAKISTHIMGYAPDSYYFTVLDKKFRLVRGKKIFLQHGIIKDDIAELHYPHIHVDLFVCSTIPEYEDVNNNYGFPEGVVKRLGLCRYDKLLSEHETKRQILVMPTWRYYARELDGEGFKNCEYYKCFNSLLSDTRLHKMLEENGYELCLYLHYELQKHSHLFDGGNGRVKILGMDSADVQQLLMESALLVTDYSSVFFDFAYMKKPLAYWQFDRERFFKEQYGEGYFKFDKDGFGPLCTEKDQVIDFIENEFKNGMSVEDIYAERVKHHFSEFSVDHCLKTYEAILDLLR
ncbi:MAG: CDP-glycerol glycerophosphotransferase family protein [Clostridia bacterium]|nr:CDP-glycerol glycerophosphotransferase family protein [Clostridia bacterium]